MKKFKNTLVLVFTLICFLNAGAQEKAVIRGRVIDKADKTIIIGANIVEYDVNERVVGGTITNLNGDFIFEVSNPQHIVRVSVIGYNAKEIAVSSAQSIMVELESSEFELEEVSVTAVSRARNSLTNIADRDRASSSVKIDLSEMQNVGGVSASDALQGRVSGLDVISSSGDPGSGSQLVIRGLSSMGNSQPLIVIDGVPQFRIAESFDLSSADSEDISNLINIALQDIKSIEVLKDAASTSIYGSQGADGVLLIETNQGRIGKVQFDYQYKYSLNIQPPAIQMLSGDEFIMLQLEQWHNSLGLFNLPREIAYDPDFLNFYNYSANTDWIGELTQNGQTHDHYFSVSGGGEKTRYFTSYSYFNESGTTIGTSAERFSTRTNLDYFLSRNLLFQIRFNYVSNNTAGNPTLSGRNVREMAYIKSPNMSVWEYDSEGNPTGDYFTPINSYQGNGVTYYNPVALARLGKSDSKFSRLENTFMLQYRLNSWMVFRETVSFQFQGSKRNSFIPYNTIGSDWLNTNVNRAREENILDLSLRTESQFAFTSPIRNKKHDFSGAFTWITEQSENERMIVQNVLIPTTQIKDPAVESQINYIGTGSSQNRSLSGLSNINYKFMDRYVFQTILRADANSSFGENNRWGLFKGLALGWRFSSEPFLESWNFLDESMLRLSWGVSGRQPTDVYARFATYESTSTGSYILRPSVAPSNIQLDNLKWETITSYNAGLDLNFFKNNLSIVTEVYRKITTDILFGGTRPQDYYLIPSSSGFDGLKYFNGGEMLNYGWEIMLDYKIIRKKDLFLSVNFNTSRNINSFSKLPDNFNSERSTAIGNGQYPLRVVEGEPIGSFFGFRYLGVWPSDDDVLSYDAGGNLLVDSDGNPLRMSYNNTYIFKGGDAMYEDVNHDGNIDLNDVVYIGDSNPDFMGGFGTTFKYKSFDFGVNFHYRLGFDIINNVAIQTEGMLNRNNQSKAVLHRWRIEGQDEEGMLPRAFMNHPANNLGSDRYVERGDFLRLNNVKIGYILNKKYCDRLGIRKANLTLSARKLLTFTRYSGQDPEVGQDATDPFWIGVDNAKTPPPRIVTLSMAIGF